jgi:exodeoxyribonuclease V alpha subunit
LSLDVLVVDEASMLDLALATSLLEAVPEHARIILIGDKDQLSAVESGAVFAELSADPTLSASCIDQLAGLCGTSAGLLSSALPASLHSHPAIANSVVWLTETFRFAAGSGVARIAADIRCGNSAGALECLASAAEPGVRWVADGAPRLGEEALRAVIDGYAPYLDSVRSGAGVAALTEVFGRFRVLAALREGARGVSGLNQLVGAQFRHALNHPLDPGEPSPWYPGRPVMVLRNDYVLKVFNGDIGIVMPDAAGELMVYFPDQESGFRQLLPRQLPEHDTAFAMTVHKAQGSEFDHVLLMLPERADNNITRELLYTAVTRCREQVTLIGDAAVIDAGIRTSTQRYSGLGARLQMQET